MPRCSCRHRHLLGGKGYSLVNFLQVKSCQLYAIAWLEQSWGWTSNKFVCTSRLTDLFQISPSKSPYYWAWWSYLVFRLSGVKNGNKRWQKVVRWMRHLATPLSYLVKSPSYDSTNHSPYGKHNFKLSHAQAIHYLYMSYPDDGLCATALKGSLDHRS